MSEPLRILYVVTEDWYFLSHRLPMARAARGRGLEVHVATRVSNGRAAIEAEGFHVHHMNWSRGSRGLMDNIAAVRQLRVILRKLRPAIVHNVAMKPALLGSLAAFGFGWIAKVNSIAGLGSLFLAASLRDRVLGGVLGRILALLFNRGRTRVIVQNPDDERVLIQLGVSPGQIVTISGSGVDTNVLCPLAEPEPPISAAYVGRMLKDKGLAGLLAAHDQLWRQGEQIELLLAGDVDPDNPSSFSADVIRDWASRPGVRWLGHVDDIATVWRQAHIAVLPSRREGMPKSLLEAAACGRPMVASDAPGCREVAINGHTALTHPIDDSAAIAACLSRLATDADLRASLGANARLLCEGRFSSDVIGAQTGDLYEGLIAR